MRRHAHRRSRRASRAPRRFRAAALRTAPLQTLHASDRPRPTLQAPPPPAQPPAHLLFGRDRPPPSHEKSGPDGPLTSSKILSTYIYICRFLTISYHHFCRFAENTVIRTFFGPESPSNTPCAPPP